MSNTPYRPPPRITFTPSDTYNALLQTNYWASVEHPTDAQKITFFLLVLKEVPAGKHFVKTLPAGSGEWFEVEQRYRKYFGHPVLDEDERPIRRPSVPYNLSITTQKIHSIPNMAQNYSRPIGSPNSMGSHGPPNYSSNVPQTLLTLPSDPSFDKELFEKCVQGWALPPEVMSGVMWNVVMDFKSGKEESIMPFLLVNKSLTSLTLPHLYRNLVFSDISPLRSFLTHSPAHCFSGIKTLTIKYMFRRSDLDDGRTRIFDEPTGGVGDIAMREAMEGYRNRLGKWRDELGRAGVVEEASGVRVEFRGCDPAYIELYDLFNFPRLTIRDVQDSTTRLSWRSHPNPLSASHLHFASTPSNISNVLSHVLFTPAVHPSLRTVVLELVGYKGCFNALGIITVQILLSDVKAFLKRSPEVESVALGWEEGCHFFCENNVFRAADDGADLLEELDGRIRLTRCKAGCCPFSDSGEWVGRKPRGRGPYDGSTDGESASDEEENENRGGHPYSYGRFKDEESESDSEVTWSSELEEGEVADIMAQSERFREWDQAHPLPDQVLAEFWADDDLDPEEEGPWLDEGEGGDSSSSDDEEEDDDDDEE